MPKTQNPKLNALPALRRTLVQRMDQMQDLLIEMRGALDMQLRLIKKLRDDVDMLGQKKGRRPNRESYFQPAHDHLDVAHETSSEP